MNSRLRSPAALLAWMIVPIVSLSASASELVGHVVGVADGDTMTVRIEGRPPMRVRLNAIDAPEKAQAFGTVAKKGLSDLCFGKNARIDVVDTDRYGRKVADVWCDGVYANRIMVEQGLAWVYRRYAGLRADLYAAELSARSKGRGLWVDENPTPPWEFRRSNKRSVGNPE